MSEKYEVIELDRYPKFGVYDGKGYCLALMGTKVNAVTICDALNRLAALEEVCREIVELQKRTYGDGTKLHLDMIDIAEKLKAVLEEA